ncbi:hypothetical protein ACH8I4_09920 [Acinetobacter sp. ABJ_C3_5]|uniref:hypothetical protein n=1 Tax=Acinetobacter courvalinii TaxID=280147 RepID=UPI0037C8FFD5
MDWYSNKSFDQSLLSIKFTGSDLDQHGVSIYDLAECLLALQRIIHKAYLAQEKKLYKGSYPKKEIREKLALQLGGRQKGSDIFALIPLVADPNINDALRKAFDYVVSGIVGYYTGDVIERLKKEPDDNKKIFIGAIHTEVANIVNRIDTVGGVEGISLGSPLLERETLAAFDSKTKDYLASIKDEYYLGSYCEIKGSVYKFYPNSNLVGIKRAGGNTVSVWLNKEDFDQIRYLKESNPIFCFKGHPRYKFGVETKQVSEFEAVEIEYINKELV